MTRRCCRRAALGVLAVALVAGCSNSEAGIPRAQTTSPGTASSASPNGLATLQPCEIFTPAEAAQLGLTEPGEYDTLGGSRSCGWTVSGSHLLGVSVWDEHGLKDLRERGTVSMVQVGGHKARRSEQVDQGRCEILLEISESSAVSVYVGARADAAKACRLAEQAAPILERKLP